MDKAKEKEKIGHKEREEGMGVEKWWGREIRKFLNKKGGER